MRLALASASAQETEAIAAGIAARLVPGDLVTVAGELGTGKTTFVRAACRALGVTGLVTSPTFTIGHRYSGDDEVEISHLDLYRLASISDAEWADLEPYFDDAIAFVEWPEAGAARLPRPRLEVSIEHAGGDRRRLELRSDDVSLLEGVE